MHGAGCHFMALIERADIQAFTACWQQQEQDSMCQQRSPRGISMNLQLAHPRASAPAMAYMCGACRHHIGVIYDFLGWTSLLHVNGLQHDQTNKEDHEKRQQDRKGKRGMDIKRGKQDQTANLSRSAWIWGAVRTPWALAPWSIGGICVQLVCLYCLPACRRCVLHPWRCLDAERHAIPADGEHRHREGHTGSTRLQL